MIDVCERISIDEKNISADEMDILLSEGGILGRVIALEAELASLKANTKLEAGDNVTIEEITEEN